MNRIITSFILLLCCGISPLQAAIQAIWSTGVAVPGEQVYLYLVDEDCGDDHFTFKAVPSIKGASVKLQNFRVGNNPLSSDGKVLEIYPLLITPDSAGDLEVGTLEVEYKSGRKVNIPVPTLPVRPTSDIKWFDSPTRYGAMWYLSKSEPYINETLQANLKIFLPDGIRAPSIPVFKAAGVKVSAFNPSVSGVVALIHRELQSQPRALAGGQIWNTQDFRGELTPFSEQGTELSASVYVERREGIFLLGEADLTLPGLSLKPLPLPPGAPASFDNLVGDFKLRSKTDAKSLAMNEAVDVEIRVMGMGSLTPQNGPSPMDAAAWKLIPATSQPILNANGERIGMIYHQLMRPVQEVAAIPAFELNFFNPESQQYEQVSSAPIPLKWMQSDEAGKGLQFGQQAAEPPPAGSVPVAEMTDIYNTLPEELDGKSWCLPLWVYALLYTPALFVLLRMAARAWRHHRLATAGNRAQEKQLAHVASQTDGLAFLKAAGAFAEKHLSPEALASAPIQALLQRRNEEAFRPDASSTISPAERKSIMQQLRRALTQSSMLIITAVMLLLLNTPSVAATPSELDQAGAQSYTGGQFSDASQSFSQAIDMLKTDASLAGRTSLARLYYHLGNAQYRLGEEGQAALSYARALQENPSLKEAQANLDFIQRKQGAILASREGKDKLFTFLTVPELRIASIIATALLLLCLSWIAARAHKFMLLARDQQQGIMDMRNERKKKSGLILKISLTSSIILCLYCAANWVYVETLRTPALSALSPEQIAYATTNTTARSAADQEGSAIITIPASTPIIILAHRPSWDYIECLNGTRGWVENKDIERLQN
ncbi:MAG: hypothetical protein R3Y56_09365 [Akkermansia sp.]